MKRMTTLVATALSLVLATGAMAGCGGQQASSVSSGTAAAAEQTQDQLIADFKKAMESLPECKSVRVNEDMISIPQNKEDSISATTVYKFDESGNQIKASVETTIDDVSMAYYIDGNSAACVADGAVYSGTVEQFGLDYANGLQMYLTKIIGQKGVLASCISEVEKGEVQGLTIYTLALDVDKYMASDEVLQLQADAGDPVKKATFIIGIEQDGSLAAIDKFVEHDKSSAEWHSAFYDLNSTTVDPMPKATKTFEEMESDLQAKFAQLYSAKQSVADSTGSGADPAAGTSSGADSAADTSSSTDSSTSSAVAE